MTELSANVEDYGWIDERLPYSHHYLAAPITALMKRYAPGRILDLGCGNGAMCRMLFGQGYAVVGCDVDTKAIEIARSQNDEIPYYPIGVYEESSLLGEEAFDLVLSTEVVEHLYFPSKLPEFASSVLNPGGRLVITTPYHGYLKNVLVAASGKWDHHHDVLTEGGHIKFWSKRTLASLVEPYGFSLEYFWGAGRVPYIWKSMIAVYRLND